MLVTRFPATAKALRVTHGVVAAFGLATLIAGIFTSPPVEDRYGVGLFPPAAAVLAGLALLAGLSIALLARRSGRGIGILIGTHATLAVTGYVMLLCYVLLG